jgi:hypothetical protein
VFYFQTRLFGAGVALDAFELRDGHPAGYQFQVIGEPGDDLLALLGRLIENYLDCLSDPAISIVTAQELIAGVCEVRWPAHIRLSDRRHRHRAGLRARQQEQEHFAIIEGLRLEVPQY